MPNKKIIIEYTNFDIDNLRMDINNKHIYYEQKHY